MPSSRPLPPRPSLEYARKEAKGLLRRLRARDPEAMARARAVHPRIESREAARIPLADAQLVVAREHGLVSWPRLVRYIGDVERQQHGHPQLHWGPDAYAAEARRLIADHRAGHARASRALSAYVPRFYGASLHEVFGGPVTEEEARLAVARGHGAPSWEVLVERLERNARTRPGEWESDPMRAASEAIAAADVSALERVVAAHPALLQPSDNDISAGYTLMASALHHERNQGESALKPIFDWLASHGLERQRELDLRLCGYGIGRATADKVRALLDQGADPNWVAPNGIPVLEHALLRYWSADAVDVLAPRTMPRKALWIAAGLGDVDGVRSFLDARGWPTRAARRLRPDCVAVGRPLFGPQLPDADDEEILVEALGVAVLNERTRVIEYLASRGAPINSAVYGGPLVVLAFNSPRPEVLECLVRCGADLDLRTDDPNGTPRELARTLFEQAPQDPWRRRIAAACGLDPDALIAEINARPARTPELNASVKKAIALAGDDAARLGQPEVWPENLLIGLLRAGTRPLHILKNSGRLEVERFRTDMADRLASAEGEIRGSALPMHADARAAIDAAIATAAARRQGEVNEFYLLHALTRRGDEAVGRLLSQYGVSAAKLHTDLSQFLLL